MSTQNTSPLSPSPRLYVHSEHIPSQSQFQAARPLRTHPVSVPVPGCTSTQNTSRLSPSPRLYVHSEHIPSQSQSQAVRPLRTHPVSVPVPGCTSTQNTSRLSPSPRLYVHSEHIPSQSQSQAVRPLSRPSAPSPILSWRLSHSSQSSVGDHYVRVHGNGTHVSRTHCSYITVCAFSIAVILVDLRIL